MNFVDDLKPNFNNIIIGDMNSYPLQLYNINSKPILTITKDNVLVFSEDVTPKDIAKEIANCFADIIDQNLKRMIKNIESYEKDIMKNDTD